MPKLLNLTSKQRDKIFRAYAKNCSPLEISRMYPGLKLSPQQVQNMVLREGWAKRKTEIAEIKKQSAAQVLAEVREQATDDFRTFLDDSGESIQEDTEKLKTGWKFVANAADVSSLMRGKKLLQERALEHYLGTSELRAPNKAFNLSAVFVRLQPAERLVQELGEHAVGSGNQDRDDSEDESFRLLPKL